MQSFRYSIIIIIAIVLSSIADVFGQSQSSLAQLLSSPNCLTACWLGIAPGDTEVSMVSKLDASNIVYEKNSLDLEGKVFSYKILSGYNNPIVDDPDAIVIFVNEQHVGAISIFLKNIAINDVINSYGTPTHITDPDGPSIELSYLIEGLIFRIQETNPDKIVTITIVGQEGVARNIYGSRSNLFQSEFTPCTNPNQLCALATATPTPIPPTATPSPTPIACTHNVPASSTSSLISAIVSANASSTASMSGQPYTINDFTEIFGFAWRPDGQVLSIGGIINGQMGYWLFDTVFNYIDYIPTPWIVGTHLWSPDGTKIIGPTAYPQANNNYYQIVDVVNKQVLIGIEQGSSDETIDWGADSTTIGIPTARGIDIYSLSGNILREIETGNQIGFDDGVYQNQRAYILASAADLGTKVQVWDTNSGNLITTWNVNLSGSGNLISISPDGQRISISTYDYTVLVYDTNNGQLISTLNPQNFDIVLRMVWHPDSVYMATYDISGTINIWNTETQEITDTASLVDQRYSLNIVWKPNTYQLTYPGTNNFPIIETMSLGNTSPTQTPTATPSPTPIACTHNVPASSTSSLISAIVSANTSNNPSTICLGGLLLMMEDITPMLFLAMRQIAL